MKKEKTVSAVGIIAEYNPFHNGHRYHMEQAKLLTGADFVVVVMSGDFVQRGNPAIYDKYTRTAMALHSGADLVLEMPAIFATSSAEDFSSCGVALLDHLGVVDSICFGSECGDIPQLNQIAGILAHEPEVYTRLLKEHLQRGLTYPQSRSLALQTYLNGESSDCLSHILNSPNNILGIEYCKALIRRNSKMKPVTITRDGSHYHDSQLLDHGFSSASSLRKAMESQKNLELISSQVPDAVFQLIKESKFLLPREFSTILNASLLRLIQDDATLSDYADVSEELEARIRHMVLDYCGFEERAQQLKTKQYTHTRISRALLHLMLGIKKTDVNFYREHDYAPYARVLGFRKDSAPLLTGIKNHGSVPLVTKTADAKQILSPKNYTLLKQDFYCSHLYQSVWSSCYQTSTPNEYNRPIVIL